MNRADLQPFDGSWRWIAIVSGIVALASYFFSSVIEIFPWSVGRFLFYAFGPSLTLAAFATGRYVKGNRSSMPALELGVLFVCIAGLAVNLMAVIQDCNFTFMRRRIAEAELESTKDALRQVLLGVNNVQLSLDIVFDIWIAAGTFFFALSAFFDLRQRVFGLIGQAIAVMALGVNFATLPDPPAEVGLFDPGPFVATWMGTFLALAIYSEAKGKIS